MNTSSIRVLHVDDDPSILELTGEFLEREGDGFVLETATSADEGLDQIRERPPDCIVSDYDMPRKSGIEFLQSVRGEWPNLPFILFTGKGSEEVASEAISKGATDYLQKKSGTDQYKLLANRIENAVEQYRSTRRASNLERIRQLTFEINQSLIRATSSEEIETQVCQLISDSDPYITACIADVNQETLYIEPRTWAGDAAGYFEELDMAVDEESPGRQAPGGRAFHARKIAVSQNIEEDEQYAKWQEPALQRDFRSLAVVPIEHGDELYGLLATFASRPNAFDQTEQKLLTELADDIGHALHSQHLQTELEQSRDFFREAERLGDIGAWEFDATGRVTWTDGTRRIYEVTDDYTPTLDQVIDSFHPDDKPAIKRMAEAALDDTESFDLQTRLITAEDNERWVHLRGKPLDDREIVRGYVKDITERKQRQQELEKNERRYQSILEDPNVLAGILDTDGTLLKQNQTGMEYIDAGLEDIVGEPFWETPWWPEDLRSVIREKVEQAASGEYVTYSADLTKPDGDVYYVTGVIRPVTGDDEQIDSLVVSARDITERKKREQQLERYERIVEHLPVGVFRTNADGDYISMNESLVEITGAESRKQLHDVGAQSIYADEEDRQRLLDRLREEGTVEGELLQIETVTGDQLWVQVTLKMVEEDGEQYLDGILRDVTDRQERYRRRERAETIFEHTQDALFLIDVDDERTTRVQRVNRAYEELTGLSTADIQGETPRELLTDKQAAAVESRYQECIDRREPIEYDEELAINGQIQYWHTRLAPVVENDRVVQLVGATRDITDRRERESELESFQRAVEEAADGVAVLEDDEYVYVDQTHVDMYGFDTEDDLLGETWRKLYDDDEVARLEEVAFPTLESESHWRGTVTGSRPDGSTFPAELSLTIVDDGRLVCTVRDETERREREQKLELVETLFQYAQESQFIVDVADGAFELRHGNEYYKRITGLSPGEPVTGQTPTELFGDAGGQELLGRYKDCVESRESVTYTVKVPVPEEGTVYRTILTPVVTDGEVTHIVGTARDITDHKRREETLKRQNERLEEFASVVSHDLRNPLRVADGRLELIREECESDHIEDVAQALGRMETLIADLLTLAREGKRVSETEPVDLADVAETCWQNVKTDDAVVNVEINHVVEADRSRLAQLLENLIRNAVEHSTDDVAVTVDDLENGFYVEDDGPGIPKDERDNVFDAGYSTTEDGTGFGLSIVEQVAEAHGWEIRVTEGTDGGARFEIIGVGLAE